MTNKLSTLEHKYMEQVVAILRENGGSRRLEAEVKLQLEEHIEDCREAGEDFQQSLGSPEDVAFEYLQVSQNTMDQVNFKGQEKNKIQNNEHRFQWGFKKSILAAIILFVFYTTSQSIATMFFTSTFVHPPNDFSFNLWFRISEMPWYNMLLVFSSACIAALITFLIFYVHYKFTSKQEL
ncbi:hypothetical protein [Bacillus horti]|uniref:Membrane protein n=1 Tax=Caldalkalibacillus horti TaxID=77523 RepID=A0ABT9VV94_9BACI|nr:hypothetical protein [Bacillus horti]MDQ0164550.1 putative membrane protein [Bacillus horti]